MFYGCICFYLHLSVHDIFSWYFQDHQNQEGVLRVAGIPIMAMEQTDFCQILQLNADTPRSSYLIFGTRW